MAKVLLVTRALENPQDNSFQRGPYEQLKKSAGLGFSRHQLVEDPKEADIILFPKIHVTFGVHIRRDPLYRAFPDKCFTMGNDDEPVPMVPGVYASLRQDWYLPGRSRAGFYLSSMENPYVDFDPVEVERDLLYSFVGSTNTWPMRVQLAKLDHPRGYFLDTSKESLPILSGGSDEQRDAFWKRYAGIARRSKFVLCPRGLGTSSIRLFESMRMGRAPVILADQWIPPSGPRWEDFSIRIPEGEALSLPRILEERENEAIALGLKARQEWERWFAPEVMFNTVVDWCLEIREARRLPEFLSRLTVFPQIFLRPLIFRAYLRSWKMRFTGENVLVE
jgi:Exostosin family